jgi:hypothetical protein
MIHENYLGLRRCIASGLSAASILVAVGWGQPVYAAKTFFVDQVTAYTPDCPAPQLYDDTFQLIASMKRDGWTGYIWYNPDAWPQDFREACDGQTYYPGGLDSTYADASSFAIFSGHGDTNQLLFGSRHDGYCDHNLVSMGRLGSMAGAQAAVALYLACSVLSDAGNPSVHNQWLQQEIGFTGLVGHHPYDYADFFDNTGPSFQGSLPNADSWIDSLGSSSPAIVVSYGNSPDVCWFIHDYARLRVNFLLFPRGGGPSCKNPNPEFWYCLDNSGI